MSVKCVGPYVCQMCGSVCLPNFWIYVSVQCLGPWVRLIFGSMCLSICQIFWVCLSDVLVCVSVRHSSSCVCLMFGLVCLSICQNLGSEYLSDIWAHVSVHLSDARFCSSVVFWVCVPVHVSGRCSYLCFCPCVCQLFGSMSAHVSVRCLAQCICPCVCQMLGSM